MRKSFIIVGENGCNNRCMLIQASLMRKNHTVARCNISELPKAFRDHKSMNGKPFSIIILVGCNLEKENIRNSLRDNYPNTEILLLSGETSIKEFIDQEATNV